MRASTAQSTVSMTRDEDRNWVRFLPGGIAQTGLGSIQPPIPCIPRTSSPGVKRSKHEVDHSPPSGTEVKNASSYTSIPPYAFIPWSLIKHTDKFNLIQAIQLTGSGLGVPSRANNPSLKNSLSPLQQRLHWSRSGYGPTAGCCKVRFINNYFAVQ